MSLESSVRRIRDALSIEPEYRTGVWAREACRYSSDMIEDIKERCVFPEDIEADVLHLMKQLRDGVVEIGNRGQAGQYDPEINTFADHIRARIDRLDDYWSLRTKNSAARSEVRYVPTI
jgi:hypothetical protein